MIGSVSSHEKSLSVPAVVAKVRPSVVTILTRGVPATPTQAQSGSGSGVIIDESGYILTNNHLVAGIKSLVVGLSTGRLTPGRVVARDFLLDLALVKITATDLVPATLSPSPVLEIGESVVAIGNPLALKGGSTVTVGVVSAVDRSVLTPDGETLYDLIQTDAAINPGNSGGPLVDLSGHVIGINVAIAPSAQAISYAISMEAIYPHIQSMIVRGSVLRPELGFTPVTITASIMASFGLEGDRGVLALNVEPRGPVAVGGVREWRHHYRRGATSDLQSRGLLALPPTVRRPADPTTGHSKKERPVHDLASESLAVKGCPMSHADGPHQGHDYPGEGKSLSRHLPHKWVRSSGFPNRSPMPRHGHFRNNYRKNGLRRDKGMCCCSLSTRRSIPWAVAPNRHIGTAGRGPPPDRRQPPVGRSRRFDYLPWTGTGRGLSDSQAVTLLLRAEEYVRKLEEVLIHTLSRWGIEGYRLEKKPGVGYVGIMLMRRLPRSESGSIMGSRFTDLRSTSTWIYPLFPISCPAAWHSATSHPWQRSGSPPCRLQSSRNRWRRNSREYSTFNG